MKATSVVVAAAALLPVAALATNVFVPPKDGYKVRWESSELIDEGRVDPWNSSHVRRMMISRFSPVPHCRKTCRVPYMPKAVAAIEDEIINAYLGGAGWPKDVLSTLELELCCDKHDRRDGAQKHGKFPKILFGTGINTTRLFYSATAQHLASRGYEIIVMDHPYETDVVLFPDGEIVFGGRVGSDPNDTAVLVKGLDVRTADLSFVMNKLKIPKTTYIGHSFGGASAAAALVKEPRLVSGVNLDGELWGPVTTTGVSRPFLTVGAAGHNATFAPGWTSFFKTMDEKHPDVFSKLLNVNDTLHNSFWDMSLVADIANLRGNEQLLAFFGKATGTRVMDVLKGYLLDFVKFTLLGKDEGLLKGPSPRFPDVTFERN
ncbi:alpha/beta-Hydrolase [Purpureocillium lavendulum]|uniref:1-alkyl-2-acetylglycerophosphocholine esterase n=1 Tax=Purpureocillium lavendulum TaxID=1247861 RepID=A0AB34FSQ9_9HYPO|nr:alpha/beta-Hydrolase [Purpureocillium lavendulum]